MKGGAKSRADSEHSDSSGEYTPYGSEDEHPSRGVRVSANGVSRHSGPGTWEKENVHAHGILVKLQGTRQYIDELVQENEAFATMVDVLRALYHWKEVVRSVGAIERAVRASAMLQSVQAATRCVLNWRIITSHERRARAQDEGDQRSTRRGEKVAAALSRRALGHALMRYFHEWRETAARHRRWAIGISAMVRRMRQRLVSECFKRWWVKAAAGASLQSAAHRVVQRSLNVRMQIGIKHWIRMWRMGIAYRRLILRFQGRRLGALAAAVFGAWKIGAQACSQLRMMQERGKKVGERQEQRRFKSLLSLSMHTWQWHFQETRRMVHSAGKIIFRRQCSSMASVVDRWKERTQQGISRRRMIGKFMRRWQRLKQAMMVDKWRDHTHRHLHAWRIATTIINRWQRLNRAVGFDTWKEKTQSTKRERGMKEKATRMRVLLAHQVSSRAFRGWRTWSRRRRQAAWCSSWLTSQQDVRRVSSAFHVWLAFKEEAERRKIELAGAQTSEGLEASRKEVKLVREQLALLEKSQASLEALSMSLQAEVTALGEEAAASMADIKKLAQQRLTEVAAELARRYKDRLGQMEAEHQAALTALEVSNREALEVARLREEERACLAATRELEQEQQHKRLLAELAACNNKEMQQQSLAWQSQLDAALQRAASQEKQRSEAEEAARLRAEQAAESASQQIKILQKELERRKLEEACGLERETVLAHAVQAAEEQMSALRERAARDAQLAADREKRLLQQEVALSAQLLAAVAGRKEAMDALRCLTEEAAVKAKQDSTQLTDIQHKLDLALTKAAHAEHLRLQEATLRQQARSDACARFMSRKALNLCRKVMCVWIWQGELAVRLSVNRNKVVQHCCMWTRREAQIRRCFTAWCWWMQHLETSWARLEWTNRLMSAQKTRNILLAWHTHGLHRSSCHSLREALVTKLQSTLQRPLLCWCAGEWFGLARAASEQRAVLVHTYRQRLASDAFDAWLCLSRQRRQFRVAVGRVTRRKERFDFLRLRNYVQGWRGFSAQALLFRVAAGKVERFHTLGMARRAYEFWSIWISMLRMSARLKAIGAQQLLRQVVWLWWEETFSRRRSAAAEKNWNTAIAVAHAAADCQRAGARKQTIQEDPVHE
jgi:chemotaxis protein histidine kinase CheA